MHLTGLPGGEASLKWKQWVIVMLVRTNHTLKDAQWTWQFSCQSCVFLNACVYLVDSDDEYPAVTGLPKAQEKHAVIMVLFATECMAGLGTILNQLAVSGLGDDTKQLAMRVGLHSGPTTAGVLRGDKGRFQLFGDTVNTASRMESNGIASRIHVSQSTANELIAKGKGHWLTARDETIVAKGKGEMQTYFVTVGTSDLGGSSYDYGRKASLVSEDSGLNSALDGSGDDSDHLKWIGQKLSERYGKNMVGMDKK